MTNQTIKCTSPVDGSLYAERQIASEQQIELALANARKAQQKWRTTSINERQSYCLKALDAMLAMTEELAPELSWQMGRPVRFAAGEMIGFEDRVRYITSIAKEALRPVGVGDVVGWAGDKKTATNRYVAREPLGLVLVIAPWNYPYLTAVNIIVPALMAGNAVILKHSEQTLLVGERFQQAFDRADLPKGLFQNLYLSHQATDKIIQSGSVNHINFTGSVGVGRKIEQLAAGTFTTMGLELGGKDPAYVRSDADIEFAVENIADGAFFNSGQCCCGVERLYIDAKVYDQVVAGLIDKTNQLVLGNPLDPETTLGPLAKSSIGEFISKQIDEALARGAVGHIDQTKFTKYDNRSNYMAPQIVTGVDHNMSLMRDESFGPVVGVMKVKSDDEAIALMNDSDFGLTASLWTSDGQAARRIADQLVTGTVYANRCDYLDPALVWTGVKNTGRGATLSSVGYEYLTRPKSLYFREIF